MTDTLLSFRVPLVLASRSPRRLRLLEQLGVAATVDPSGVDETVEAGMDPGTVVRTLALRKAKDVALRHPKALVLGADTIVVLDGQILGQPEDPLMAGHMLRRLSGRTHAVFTGIALIHPPSSRAESDHARTEVTFGDLTDAEIARYVQGGSPMDKAGAYGIQDDTGALFVEALVGDYYNVVGLPLRTLYRLATRFFGDLLRE